MQVHLDFITVDTRAPFLSVFFHTDGTESICVSPPILQVQPS